MLRVLAIGLLSQLLLAGCGADQRAPIALYHLESQISGPVASDGDLTCGQQADACPNVIERDPAIKYRYRVSGDPALHGNDIDRDATRAEVDSATGEPVVLLHFNAEGRRKFHELTGRLAQVGRRQRRPQHFAIVVQARIVSFPQLDYLEYPNGLDASRGIQISGLLSLGDTRRLAQTIRGD